MNETPENETDTPSEEGTFEQDADDSDVEAGPSDIKEEPVDGDGSADSEDVEADAEETNDGDSDDPFAAIPRPDLTTLRIRMFNVSGVFYVIMGLIGLFWMHHQGIIHQRLATDTTSEELKISLAMGVAVAAAVFLFGAIVRRVSDWAVTFEEEFAPLVNVFSYMQVPMIAFLSAAGEELLFRGALQEAISLWPAAILFGLIHIPWKKVMIPWPVFAFVLGLVFGYIVEYTGSLYGPFLGHFLINLVNIILIKRRHPMDEDEIIDELMSD